MLGLFLNASIRGLSALQRTQPLARTWPSREMTWTHTLQTPSSQDGLFHRAMRSKPCFSCGISGTEKAPQRTCATKILPNFWVNFLTRFASKYLFYWVVPSNCSENSLAQFVRFFGFGVLLWPLRVALQRGVDS